jgi:NADH dehydrogenase FAD-containing subunit
MSGTGQQTIVVIGLSGAGLKTFNLLLEQLNHAKNYQSNIRIIAIEKSHYPYWAPGSLRASVLNGFEHKVVRNFDHLIPTNIQRHHPDQVNIFTGTEVRELDLKNRLLTLDKPLDLDGLQIIDETGNKLKFDYLVIASVSNYNHINREMFILSVTEILGSGILLPIPMSTTPRSRNIRRA